MIKINLLIRSVAEKEKKANVARQLAIVIVASAVFALLLASVQIYVMRTIANLEGDIKTSEARLVELKKILGEIDDMKAEKNILEKNWQLSSGLRKIVYIPFDCWMKLMPWFYPRMSD